jgi:hypothetical protein
MSLEFRGRKKLNTQDSSLKTQASPLQRPTLYVTITEFSHCA